VAREVDAEGLEAASDVQLVDVRTAEERDAGRIPTDTAHIPFDAFAASGFDASSLAGVIVAWQESGRPVEGEVGHPSGLPPR
jgi:hypothetical protein